MKGETNKVLAMVALVLFVISLFLPSYFNGRGYECVYFCLHTIWPPNDLGFDTAYYFVFNITNLLMMVTPIAIVCGFYQKAVSQRNRLLFAQINTLLFLHVLSWWLIHLFSKEGIEKIQIGYYLWAISIGLCTFVIWKEKNRFIEKPSVSG